MADKWTGKEEGREKSKKGSNLETGCHGRTTRQPGTKHDAPTSERVFAVYTVMLTNEVLVLGNSQFVRF